MTMTVEALKERVQPPQVEDVEVLERNEERMNTAWPCPKPHSTYSMPR
jgi:hypothetical protein